jgi:hypothetical protein
MQNRENQRIIRLKATLKSELEELEKLKREIDGLNIEETHPRILGSILNDFYTGVERIFSRIAEELEGGLPNGASWHRELLNGMSIALEEIRPAVIREELKEQLDEYLRFRHLFRNVYGFHLDKTKLTKLINGLEDVFIDFQQAIQEFNQFLMAIASEIH